MLNEAVKEENISLTLSRDYAVDAQTLFDAWSKPEQLKQWFCPGEVLVNEINLDFRVGGDYRIVIQYPDGGEQHIALGEYTEIDEPNKIVFSFNWETKQLNGMLVTLLFEPSIKGCKMTLIHDRFVDEHTRDLHMEGWNGSFHKLEQLLGL